MKKISIEMSPRDYKMFLVFKETDKTIRNIKKGLAAVQEARKGKRVLKSAYQLANEL